MIPKTLEIEGFLSYRHKEVLDFESFDLACITGKNGAGKSSILDAITWSLFGKARKSDESIINLQSDEAVVNFVFEYEGNLYKITRRNPRDQTKSVDVSAMYDGKWKSMSERTLRATDEKIENIFGLDYETFVNVSFFLQGKADQFTQQSPSNRKRILSQILGLDVWEQYRRKAWEYRRDLEKELAGVESVIEELSNTLEDEELLKDEVSELQERLESYSEVVKGYKAELDSAKKLYDALESMQSDIDREKSDISRLEEKLERLEKTLEGRERDLRICNEYLEDADQIESKYEEWKSKQEELDTLDDLEDDWVEAKRTATELKLKIRQTRDELENQIHEWEDNLETLQEDAEAEADIMILGDTIHKLKELEGECPTCLQSIDDEGHQELIDSYQEKYDRMVKEWVEDSREMCNKEIDRLEKELETCCDELENELEEVENTLAEIDYDSTRHEELKKYVREHRKISTRYAELQKKESEAKLLKREISSVEGEIEELEKDIDKKLDSYEDKVAKFEEAREDLPDLDKLKKEYEDTLKVENEIRHQLGAAEQRLKALQASQERLERLEKDRKALARDITVYERLEKAFSKDGIPALLIEEALPEIEDKANQILDRLSDGAMSVRFITQREYKDESREDKKETLDIQIQDQSGIRDYEMYSGGESFRINFAIRLALSFVLSQRAGAKIQTLVIDEGFGSQDVMGKERLVEAIGLVREDFEKILIITHVEYLKEIFTNQILVQKKATGSEINVL